MSRFQKIIADRYVGWTLEVPKEFAVFAREHSFRRDWNQEPLGLHTLFGRNRLKPKQR
jgi:hypothetical protein